MHRADQWRQKKTQGNLNVTRVPLTVLMWNVRGLNAPKKQQYLDWLIASLFSNIKGDRKVKALGTYLNWTKALLGGENVQILNAYL